MAALQLVCRDQRGVVVTIIADNYFGYCKKEVKSQISYAANLYGLCEEEHAGGAIAFPAYVLGQDFLADVPVPIKTIPFAMRCGCWAIVSSAGRGLRGRPQLIRTLSMFRKTRNST